MLSNKQQGFSLLEILIAFSILAFSLSILLNIFSSGVNSAMISEEYTAAIQIAESLMVKSGVESKLQVSHTDGTVNEKYRWQVDIQPFDFVTGKFKLKSSVELYKVDVVVAWVENEDNDRQVRLSTLKLANKDQQ